VNPAKVFVGCNSLVFTVTYAEEDAQRDAAGTVAVA
jgi:hypothetical protein